MWGYALLPRKDKDGHDEGSGLPCVCSGGGYEVGAPHSDETQGRCYTGLFFMSGCGQWTVVSVGAGMG
ncbi:MAG: hypothetical protein Kow0099_16290 [Candidatus Abyssubacteria bacterium]